MSTKEQHKQTGTIKWFNTKQGFGFAVNASGEDVFIHYRSIQQEGFKNLTTACFHHV